jgi:hypothetical protein
MVSARPVSSAAALVRILAMRLLSLELRRTGR